MFERIRRYKYDPHFQENIKAKAEAQQAANEHTATEAKEKKGLFKRIAGFFGRLFRKEKSN
ncbi:MAG: hypothetical protein IK038_10325 [Bacteroidaceae bacterium]|nr:hypothetical protein [Bacteroidaceae bacterium]